MNHINEPIVTPAKIQKARRINPDGVLRLATFVCVSGTDPWRVYEGCQQQRVMALAQPRVTDRRVR